jgi:membrane dipeptidase
MTEVSESQNVLRLCATRQEIEDSHSRGEIALLLAPSFVAIGDRLDRLRTYKVLGAVMFPLSLNTRNILADGCGERQASGLSHLGVQAVQMLNHLGIVIDVSHLSERAFWDCLAISTQPVIASHSNARAICDNPRNLTEEQARAIAEKGGCIGVSVHPSMLADESPTIADYVKHVLHFIRIAGEDHVMLGADFIDYQIEFILPKLRPSARLGIYNDSHVSVPDLSGFADLSKVVTALKAANLGPEVVNKIAGSNFLRVIETVCG